MKAQRESGGIAVWMVKITLRPIYIREEELVPIVQVAGWAPGPV